MAFQQEQDNFIHFDPSAQDEFLSSLEEFQPQTPKNVADFFPITPEATPSSNCSNAQQKVFSHSIESSPVRHDPQLTIKASQAMQRGSSYQDNFGSLRQMPMSPAPSPPHTAPLRPRGSIDYSAFPPPSSLNMSELNIDINADGGGYSSVECSPMTKASSNVSSLKASPEMMHMSLFGKLDAIDSDTMAARLLSLAESPSGVDYSTDTIKPAQTIDWQDPIISNSALEAMFANNSSPFIDRAPFPTDSTAGLIKSPPSAKGHTRYDSFSSVYSSNSFTAGDQSQSQYDPNYVINTEISTQANEHARSRSQAVSETDSIQEVIENTGVSIDEINSFIGGPDENHRWICLVPGCLKHQAGETFGRKENIKSHVQGHLKDRQYRCKVCQKTFVRQHDLKRHANIHTLKVVKACKCGKEFARADALTRHRQRGMCAGAFEGTPKKVAKRGRPKKSRPETEERSEKAAATRQRVLERMVPANVDTSSISSMSSHPSPDQVFESPNMEAQPMSRQASNASSFYSTPPELDLTSSSPFSVPNFEKDFPLAMSPPATSTLGPPLYEEFGLDEDEAFAKQTRPFSPSGAPFSPFAEDNMEDPNFHFLADDF